MAPLTITQMIATLITLRMVLTLGRSLLLKLRNAGKSNNNLIIHINISSIEKDAQLLANRIALLKQEEMKTWKKIEETKKRTNEISHLKRRNEEKVQKVKNQ
jgi:hypothetical protein